MAEDISIIADKVIAESKEIISRIKTIHGVDGAISAVPEIVVLVEKIAETKTLASEDKKKLAVEIINKLIDIPVLPEAVEGIIIGYAVDMFVMGLNKLLGKDWLEKIA